uniref:Ig-like domain-containing protein n=1 Tax=Scleropages formosus TaxID=113540 RepID=A0A8C9VMJ6_SCLFO
HGTAGYDCITLIPLLCACIFLPDITLADDIVQPNVMMKALLGDSVTLTCFCTKDEITYIAWFEQPFGQKPQIVAKALFYSQDVEFQAEFENRLSLQWIEATKSFNMTILKTELSDSAVYYCVTVLYNEVTFGDGTVLILTDSNSRTVVQQPVSDPARPGDSVTLQCTVDRETCAGEHSVYWFRHGSGESLPGLIYTHGNRSDECEKSPEAGSPTHSCVYSLPKRNLSPSDAGIYYCAVATCGDILFGRGTKISMEDGKVWTEENLTFIYRTIIKLSNVSFLQWVICLTCRFGCTSEKAVLVWLSIVRSGVLICILLMFTVFYFILK